MADSAPLSKPRTVRLVPPWGALELTGRSSAALRTQELVRRAAALESYVLLVAEPGVDAEGVARELHARGRSAAGPFVGVDCSAAQNGQIDRALFGSLAAHTPADLEPVAGDSRLAAAQGGTLYLENVVDLPAIAQTRLARLVRDSEMRLDGVHATLAARIIATASPAIDDDVHAHRFRPELYRRLAVTRIELPPLRERAQDVPALAERVLGEVCAATASGACRFTTSALALLAALPWPGNVGELRAVIAQIIEGHPEPLVQVEQVVPALPRVRTAAPFIPSGKLREARLRFEREYIAAVLQHHGWRMNDAALTLGIQRPNLYRKARQLGIPVTRLTE